MFHSFFPRPRLLLLSSLVWLAIAVVIWYGLGEDLGATLGFQPADPEAAPVLGLGHFVTPQFLWFYLFCGAFLVVFAFGWFRFSPHPYQWWSIVGSAFILFATYFGVQVSVAINNWRGPFFDLIQKALDTPGSVSPGEFYSLIGTFAEIAFVAVAVFTLVRFFTSHYIFRWRQAMNNYYMSRWSEIRGIEGASQRVQEDTMRFAGIMENLGVSIVESIMTLFAFLPLLLSLSSNVETLPIVGAIPYPLVLAALFWAIFGTTLLAVAGIRLPGLEFRNQRVEAAYRKELVYGEDSAERAQPITTRELFQYVRQNYFRLYLNYAYFNVFRSMYLQADNIFAYLLLIPTIAAGTITLGIMQQIISAFGQVSDSFKYLVYSWSTIIELLSIHKRLIAFERAFEGRALSGIEKEALPAE